MITPLPRVPSSVRAYDEARARGTSRRWPQPRWAWRRRRRSAPFPAAYRRSCTRRYTLAGGEQRARLAVAMARAWAYGGDRRGPCSSPRRRWPRPRRAATGRCWGRPGRAAAGPLGPGRPGGAAAHHREAGGHGRARDRRGGADVGASVAADHRAGVPGRADDPAPAAGAGRAGGGVRVRAGAVLRGVAPRDVRVARRGLEAAELALREAVAQGTERRRGGHLRDRAQLAAGIARQRAETATLAREAAAYEAFGVQEADHLGRGGGALRCGWAAGEPEPGPRRCCTSWRVPTSGASRASRLGADDGVPDRGGSRRDRRRGAGRDGRCCCSSRTPAGRWSTAAGSAFAGVVDDYLARACGCWVDGEEARRWAARRPRSTRAWARPGGRGALAAPRPARRPTGGGAPAPRCGRHLVGGRRGGHHLRDMRGLHYLRLVLQRPGVDIPALVTCRTRSPGHPGAGLVEGGAGEVLDRQAL